MYICNMNDTKPEVIQKQREIFFAKSPGERLRICLDMIDFGRTLMESQIRSKNPEITDNELKAEVFKAFYKNDFPSEKLEEIANWLRSDL